MAQVVVTGAMLQCSFGVAPSPFNSVSTVTAGGVPVGTIKDSVPMLNIKPFGVCSSLANPTVAAATASALGVLTPMPCIPAVAAPWVPGSPTVMATNMPLLTSTSKCMCNWGGVIQVTYPGQVQVSAP